MTKEQGVGGGEEGCLKYLDKISFAEVISFLARLEKETSSVMYMKRSELYEGVFKWTGDTNGQVIAKKEIVWNKDRSRNSERVIYNKNLLTDEEIADFKDSYETDPYSEKEQIYFLDLAEGEIVGYPFPDPYDVEFLPDELKLAIKKIDNLLLDSKFNLKEFD